MNCCDNKKAISALMQMAQDCKVRHHHIEIFCTDCGYTFPDIDVDDANYCVERTLSKMRCPVCFSKELSVSDVTSQDRFDRWDGKVDVDGAEDEDSIARLIESARDTKGSA